MPIELLPDKQPPKKTRSYIRNLRPQINVPYERYPFEHTVVAYRDLHPELKKEVDLIRLSIAKARASVANNSYLLTGATSFVALHPKLLYAVMPMKLAGVALEVMLHKKVKNASVDVLNDEKRLAKTTGIGRTRLGLYSNSMKMTKNLKNVIQSIAEKDEEPFKRDDCNKLLSKFHYGFVDNHGNLVFT